MSDHQRVKVGVRVRPMAPKELNERAEIVLQKQSSKKLLINIPAAKKEYDFDFVFGPESTQFDVYNSLCKSLIDSIFLGYNATIFAYGQTGSGKSHTMGTGGSMAGGGIIPCCIQDIFHMKEKLSSQGSEISISFSYMEVYNEECYDLLSEDRRPLKIQEVKKEKFEPKGLKQVSVDNEQAVESLIALAMRSRSTASTAMNNDSSRSHAIATVTIRVNKFSVDSENEGPNDSMSMSMLDESVTGIKTFLTSKLRLVDLAGSERVKKTGAVGEVRQQGININKADSNADETLNTLDFASKANSIKNTIQANKESEFSGLDRDALMKEIIFLRKQNETLRKRTEGSSTNAVVNPPLPPPTVSFMTTHNKTSSSTAPAPHVLATTKHPSSSSSSVSSMRQPLAELDVKGGRAVAICSKPVPVSSSSSSSSVRFHPNTNMNDSMCSRSHSDDFEATATNNSMLNMSVEYLQTEDIGNGDNDYHDENDDPNEIGDDDVYGQMDHDYGDDIDGEMNFDPYEEEAAKIDEILQNEIRQYQEMEQREKLYEMKILELQNEIEVLRVDGNSLRVKSSGIKRDPVEMEKIRIQIAEKNRLVFEKENELKIKKQEFDKARQQKDRAEQEAEKLRLQLEDSKKRRAEAQRQLKEESQKHREERQNLQRAENQLRRREQENKKQILSLEQQLLKKEQVLRVQIKAKEQESQKVRLLTEKQLKVKNIRDQEKQRATVKKSQVQDGFSKSTEDHMSKPEQERLAMWLREEIDAQIRRDELAEDIAKELEIRKKTSARLIQLRQDQSAMQSRGEGDKNSALVISKATEIVALSEENKQRTHFISQKQNELASLGVISDKRRFAGIVQAKEAKASLNIMFQMLTKDMHKTVRELEKRISSQKLRVQDVKKDIPPQGVGVGCLKVVEEEEEDHPMGCLDISLIEPVDADADVDGEDDVPISDEAEVLEAELEEEDDLEDLDEMDPEEEVISEADETFLPEEDDGGDSDYGKYYKRHRQQKTIASTTATSSSSKKTMFETTAKHRASIFVYSSAHKTKPTDGQLDTAAAGSLTKSAVKKRPLSDGDKFDFELETEGAEDSSGDIIDTVPREPMSAYNIKQLKAFLKARSLTVSGRKEELISRLREALKNDNTSKRQRFDQGRGYHGYVLTAT
eukprot:gene1612-3110_t